MVLATLMTDAAVILAMQGLVASWNVKEEQLLPAPEEELVYSQMAVVRVSHRLQDQIAQWLLKCTKFSLGSCRPMNLRRLSLPGMDLVANRGRRRWVTGECYRLIQ